jgi:hypothetical protein
MGTPRGLETVPRPTVANGEHDRVTRAAAILCFFAVLTAVVHRDLARHAGDAIYAPPATSPADGPPIGTFGRGDQLLHVWALATNLRHLRTDPTCLFEANGFYPHPRSLFFSDHLFGQAVVAWPLTPFIANPLLLHNLLLLASFVLSGAGLALLVARTTGNTLAGIIGGVVWTLSPPRLFEVFQLQLLTTQWIPVVFMCLQAALASARWAPALAAAGFFWLQVQSGIYVGAYLVLSLLVFLPARLVTLPPALAWRAGWRLAVAFGLAAAAAAPWLLQYLRVSRALGEYGGLLENVAYALSVQHYLLPSWMLGRDRFPGLLGITLGLLLVIGIVWPAARARRERAAYVAAALWVASLSLGPYVRFAAGPETWSAPAFLGRGPYAVLYGLVPGLEALRVPARAALLVGFFFAVLAGFGAARILDAVRRPLWRVLLATLIASAVVVESQPRVPEIERVSDGEVAPAVYRWLRDEGGPGAVVELPMNVLRDPVYLYHSTGHWRPLVNGYGAYLPTAHLYLQRALADFPRVETVTMLRELGVRYVITHGLRVHALEGRLDVALAVTYGTDAVYEIVPGLPVSPPPVDTSLRPLATAGWRAASGANPEDAGLAIDGDPRTAWANVGDLSRDLLGARGGGLAWLHTLDSWTAFHAAYAFTGRDQSLSIDFGATVEPVRVEILVITHQSPIFAPFALSVADEVGSWTRIDCPWEPVSTVAAFAADPAHTWLGVTCDFPPTTRLRLAQEPRQFRIYWELAEVRVFVAAAGGAAGPGRRGAP